ncbi:MAG TPA: hypothetical protein VFI06_14795 [Chitinophagaceae bacterium]|nr:hypothetical protein [Chitinophagaceae bacterium]
MKSTVKTLALLTIFLFSFNLIHAQIKLFPGSNFALDLKKVIEDYPNHFENITGDLIVQNPQSTDYQCNFRVNGAEECTITKYSGKKEPVNSWQALMLTTDNFETARKKYRALYNELNNLQKGSMHLKGEYDSPAEEKKFTSVLFSFDPPTESIKKLKVELVLEAEGMDWKVRVLVYDRNREDDEKGETQD